MSSMRGMSSKRYFATQPHVRLEERWEKSQGKNRLVGTNFYIHCEPCKFTSERVGTEGEANALLAAHRAAVHGERHAVSR